MINIICILNSRNNSYTHMLAKNDKNMLKYGVCISMFLLTFCYSTLSLAVPFTTVKLSGVRAARPKRRNFCFLCSHPIITVAVGCRL